MGWENWKTPHPPQLETASQGHLGWGWSLLLGVGYRGGGNQAWPPFALETGLDLGLEAWGASLWGCVYLPA